VLQLGQGLVRRTLTYTVNSGLFHASAAALGITREQRARLRILGREDAFSKWNFNQVKEVFATPQRWDPPSLEVPKSLVAGAFSRWNFQMQCSEPDPFEYNEASRLRLVDAIISVIPVFSEFKLKLRYEVILYHEDSQSHGPVDYTVGGERDHHLLIIEAKATDFQQGIAQNMLQLECASMMQSGADVYGVVTDGFKWVFLLYTQNKFYLSQAYSVEQQLELIVSVLCKIAQDWQGSPS